MPLVTVLSRPSGAPTAITGSPTTTELGGARAAATGRPVRPTLMTARSYDASRPTIVRPRARAVGELDRDVAALRGAGDDVVVGEDVALGLQDEAGAGAGRVGALDLDRHHAGQRPAAMPAIEPSSRAVDPGTGTGSGPDPPDVDRLATRRPGQPAEQPGDEGHGERAADHGRHQDAGTSSADPASQRWAARPRGGDGVGGRAWAGRGAATVSGPTSEQPPGGLDGAPAVNGPAGRRRVGLPAGGGRTSGGGSGRVCPRSTGWVDRRPAAAAARARPGGPGSSLMAGCVPTAGAVRWAREAAGRAGGCRASGERTGPSAAGTTPNDVGPSTSGRDGRPAAPGPSLAAARQPAAAGAGAVEPGPSRRRATPRLSAAAAEAAGGQAGQHRRPARATGAAAAPPGCDDRAGAAGTVRRGRRARPSSADCSELERQGVGARRMDSSSRRSSSAAARHEPHTAEVLVAARAGHRRAGRGRRTR